MNSRFLTILFSAVAGGLASIAIWHHFQNPNGAALAGESAPVRGGVIESSSIPIGSVFSEQKQQAADEYTPEEIVNIDVYDKVNQSVVNIDTRSVRVDNFFMMAVPTEGSGSGWVLDKQGHIVTNNHVIEGSDSVQVTLSDGSTHQAQVVGTDPTTDISVLKIEAAAESLIPLELGDSAGLRVGQRVFAIGNPYGLERTMSVGIISSLNRTLAADRGRRLKNMIQLDAALNQGNSGGPLLNSHARLIGMNTAIATLTGQSSGVGFAVPVNVIKRTIPELIQFGKVVRASLGLEAVWETRIGVGIAKTETGGAAEKAGLRGGLTSRNERMGNINIQRTFFDHENADIILRIDGIEVHSADDINNLINEKKPADQVVLSILRRGKQTEVNVTLGAE